MSSTEQKNVSQPFISCCHSFGILPTLLSNGFCNAQLETSSEIFGDLGPTPSIGNRCRSSDNPVLEAQRLLPSLANAPSFSRTSPLLLWLAHDSRVYYGNQSVYRLVESILVRRWNLHFSETGAIRHARSHTARTCSYFAPGSYGDVRRTESNVQKLRHRGNGSFYRCAADVFDFLAHNTKHYRHERRIRSWCHTARQKLGFGTSYRTSKAATNAYLQFDREKIYELPTPEALSQRYITTGRHSKIKLSIYYSGSNYFIRVEHKYPVIRRKNLTTYDSVSGKQVSQKLSKTIGGNDLFVLSYRDMIDCAFLLTSASQMHIYFNRRKYDARNRPLLNDIIRIQTMMWSHYTEIMGYCGEYFHLRNKLGVYFDVLQWRYLAWKSGDIFYNHSEIMAAKIQSKDLVDLPSQSSLLQHLKDCPVDLAVDMLGLYKASIYPEVDPFKVVADQQRLHLSRFDTNWEPGSDEAVRFDETKAYMWYLGIRVLHSRFNTWPGKLRAGVEHKDWHSSYKQTGLPGNLWREAHDIDLTGCVTVADITNEAYFRQQDSACAPPLWHEYKSFAAMRSAPRRHKRKLLYAIQESELEDLPRLLHRLNQLGSSLPDDYTGRVQFETSFSTDIVTGSRCERHKDAPRPFYATSPPWGCVISYFDGITRDFLSHVPQSMLGKSTRQKFMDLSSTAAEQMSSPHTFYMSDDKAKYSPRMDPRSQQLPADFFAELFDIPGIKAYGPIMYHCELYYRVHGHLVHYNSNGTDREGMRGASNTWLEIVAQGLTTRLSRERGLLRGKSTFLSFIDDGLRKFSVEHKNRTEHEIHQTAIKIIQDVIFGLRVLGRELSWDKTFISQDLFVILNELVIDGAFISSGLKSFCTVGDIEMKEVMSAADYEQLYFGKLRGAHGVGAPIDLCHYTYVFETIASHYRMGVNLQNNKKISNLDYRLFCSTPLAFGGAGLRSPLQMCCNEVATATKEGLGNLLRLGNEYPVIMGCVCNIINQPFEPLSPIDFMREPEQLHVTNPRIKTQRLAAEVRKQLRNLVGNEVSQSYLEQDEVGMSVLTKMGKIMMATGDVSAEEVRLLYATTPVAFVDEFIQKLASSITLSEILGRDVINATRRAVKRDLISAAEYFQIRCGSRDLYKLMANDMTLMAMVSDLSA